MHDFGLLVVQTKEDKISRDKFNAVIDCAYAVAINGYVRIVVNNICFNIGGGDDRNDIVRKYEKAGGTFA